LLVLSWSVLSSSEIKKPILLLLFVTRKCRCAAVSPIIGDRCLQIADLLTDSMMKEPFCLSYKFKSEASRRSPLCASDNDHPMANCDRCGRYFPHDRALQQHKDDSSSHWLCYRCNLDFASFEGRQQHYAQTHCKECNSVFRTAQSRIQHMESDHWYCRLHDKVSIPHTYYYRFEPETNFCACCRLSVPELASDRTAYRAPVTTHAGSAQRSVVHLFFPLHISHFPSAPR